MRLNILNNDLLNRGILAILDSKMKFIKQLFILFAIVISMVFLGLERLLSIINPLNYRKAY